MLNEHDQELLLELLLANILYVNLKTAQGNPFVKKMGQSDIDKAFEILIEAINNCSHLIPQLKELNLENTEVMGKDVDLEQYL